MFIGAAAVIDEVSVIGEKMGQSATQAARDRSEPGVNASQGPG